MAAANYPITIEQGATFSKTIVYKDANGNPVNLTNVTEARAQVRPTASSSTFKDFVVAVSGSPANGTLSWSMAASVTETLAAPYSQVYDLEIEFASGEVRRLIQGTVTIVPEVTRDEP